MSQEAGYDEATHSEGWSLLLRVLGHNAEPTEEATEKPKLSQEVAIANLDEWDGTNFARARAALQYRFPDQLRYIFYNLNAATGAGAIASVQVFIDRVVALRDGTDQDRAASREPDHQAAELLAKRKILDPGTEDLLRTLIEQATEIAPNEDPPDLETTDDYAQAAAELHAWLSDWRAQARESIHRGDYRTRLGLTSRRARPSATVDPADEGTDETEVLDTDD